MFRISLPLLALLLLPITSTTYAQLLTFQSGERRNLLIELYTSQGCSSCQPAEQLLSNLLASDKLWKSYFPLALHVDYWNYLGWTDTYANPLTGERQQQHLKLNNISNIYTPEFVINAKEWRGFFRADRLPPVPTEVSGQLVLQFDTETKDAKMQLHNLAKTRPALCHFGLLTFDENVEIMAGENSGLTIAQDFVLLSLDSVDAEFNNNNYQCRVKVSALEQINNLGIDGRKYAIIGWMENIIAAPIQVTGGWLPAVP